MSMNGIRGYPHKMKDGDIMTFSFEIRDNNVLIVTLTEESTIELEFRYDGLNVQLDLNGAFDNVHDFPLALINDRCRCPIVYVTYNKDWHVTIYEGEPIYLVRTPSEPIINYTKHRYLAALYYDNVRDVDYSLRIKSTGDIIEYGADIKQCKKDMSRFYELMASKVCDTTIFTSKFI